MAPSLHRWWAPGFPRCWLDLNQQIKSAKNIQYTVYLHCVAGRLVFCLDPHIFTFKPLLKPLDFPNCIFIPPASLYGIFLGRYEQVSATPDRVPRKDQSIHQSPMWWVMSLFGLTDEHICEELLTGAETTPRKPRHQSPLQNRWELTKAGDQEHPTQPKGSCSDWNQPFPGGSTLPGGLTSPFLFQTGQLIWECFLSILTLYTPFRKEKSGVSGKFQGLPEALELFPSY